MPPADTSLREQMHTLYSDHHGWLKGWMRRRTGCSEQAADLAQDTFLRAYTSRQLAEIEEPRAFLTTLARRVLHSFWRRQQLEQAWRDALAALPEEYVPSTEELVLVHEALATIDRALQGLPAPVRRVFLLHRLEGLTQARIAEETALSLATVERHMRRAYLHCLAEVAHG